MGRHGNEAGAERLVAYQKFLRRERHLADPHHRAADRRQGDGRRAAGRQSAGAAQGRETEHGIVVRGARILATLAPFADEIAVYPALPLPAGADDYALSFCIPMSAPGLKFLCRDSVAPANRFDHPLSSRFDEQDAFVIFDDVEVPRERLFIDANRRLQHGDATSWPPNIQQQTMIRASVKLEFAWGLALRMAGRSTPPIPRPAHDRRDLEPTPSSRARPSRGRGRAREWPGGMWTPRPAAAACPARHPAAVVPAGERDHPPDRLAQPLRHADRGANGRHGAAPADRPYLPGAKGMPAEERIRIFRLAWDFAGSALPAATSSTSASTSPRRRAISRAISSSPTAAGPTGWSTGS